MTNTSKWVTVGLGFGICFYIGWFFPVLWLIYLVTILVVLVVPTKPTAASIVVAPAVVETSYTQDQVDMTELEEALRAKIASARNDDVREGMMEALALIQATSISYSVDTPMAMVQSAVVSAAPALSEVDIVAAKQRQELRNINTILYVACFLLVGAAALFIGFTTDLPPTLKFMALLLVASAFYGVGLVLHRNSQRLRPAAVAFVGTGLALIPFVGLAFYSYVVTDGPLVWWLTSLVGLAAFWLALLMIRAQVMSYLTLAFVFSLATSSVSVMHAPFVWYFIAIILTSSILMYAGYKKPRWLPHELLLPLEQNAQLATPIALIGSLFMIGTLSSFDYALISGVAALHYAVNALDFSTDRTRYIYWVLARALSVVFALTMTYHFTTSWRWVCTTLIVSAIILHFYAVATIAKERREEIWLWATQAAVLLSLFGWWDNMSQVSAGFVILMALSAHQLYVMKRSEFAALGLVAAAALPITILHGSLEPAMALEYVGFVVGLMAVASLAARVALQTRHASYQIVSSIGYGVFIFEALILVTMSGELMWLASLATAASVLLYLAAFVERQSLFHVLSNILAVVGVFILYGESLGDYTWAPLATTWTLGVLWYALRWYFAQNNDEELRADIMFISSFLVLLFGAVIAVGINDTTLVAGALTGCAAAALFAYEGYVRKLNVFYEGALYILTLSLQQLVAHVYPDASFLVYTHWWALTTAAAAGLYLSRGERSNAIARGIIALTIISVPTGLFAFDDPSRYQLLFLLEHAILAVGGLVTGKKLVVQWGAAGVGLAMLWLLQGYTYILLTVLALGLIGFAVWRLMKKS